MKQESDLVYLDRRAIEERRAALKSDNRNVREVHLEFASAYEFRIHLMRQQAARTRAAEGAPAQEPAIQQEVPTFMIGR